MYVICFLSATLRDKSLREFLESGRAKSIKKDIIRFLSANPSKSYTASQLQIELNILCRSSVCYPLLELVKLSLIEVVGSQYDTNTHKEVGLYQLSKTLFNG